MQQQLLDAGEDGAAPSRSLSLRTRVAATGLVGSAHVMGELHGRQAQEERRHHPSSDRQFGLAEVVLAAMLQQLPFVVSSGGKVEWSWPPGGGGQSPNNFHLDSSQSVLYYMIVYCA